jgi:hypothetical protein
MGPEVELVVGQRVEQRQDVGGISSSVRQGLPRRQAGRERRWVPKSGGVGVAADQDLGGGFSAHLVVAERGGRPSPGHAKGAPSKRECPCCEYRWEIRKLTSA